MKLNQNSINRACTIAMSSALLGLAGCGGGGGDSEPASTPAPAPAVTTLQSSGGDLTKYANTLWVSECGLVIAAGAGLTSQITTLRFDALSGTSVSGSVSASQYTTGNCTGALKPGSGVNFAAVTFKYVKQLTVTSGTPATVQGTADELLITEIGSGATQTFTVGFLPDFLKLETGATSYFSSASLKYTKR